MIIFITKKHFLWLINTEKMFSILSHQGNGNQSYIEIPPHLNRMSVIKNAGEDAGG
jgi:hypothetical protein